MSIMKLKCRLTLHMVGRADMFPWCFLQVSLQEHMVLKKPQEVYMEIDSDHRCRGLEKSDGSPCIFFHRLVP